MFGTNNKPFGNTTAFGGSSFGSTAPFGQNSTAFGAKPATNNVFGASTFGVSTPNTGGLFGTTSQSTGSGLFGQPSSTFGTPASTSTGTFGGFGTTSASGGLFGSTAPATQSSGSLFGSSSSAFGAPRPTFGGFGATNPGTGLFGQSTSTGTGLFGSSGFTATVQTGTTVKFNPPTGTDTMMKGGVSTNISTRHQCITCMKEYENKSLEELRVEDYVANRKGAAPGGITFGGTTQTGGGLFGSTPAASTSGFSFGTTQSKPLFGTTGTTNAFGSSSIFGQPAQNQNTGLFGKSVGFGPTTTAAPVFNFGGTNTMGTGTSLFGQNNQQKPLFGQTTSTTGGLFGNTATTQSTGFGTTGGFGAFGATSQPSTGLFGAKTNTGFGTTNTTTTNSFSFGNTNNMSGGLFGQKPAAQPFGTNTGFGTQSSGFGSFGSTSTLGGTGLFGQNKPATSVFGNTGSTFGTGLGNTFGSSTFPSMGGLGSNTGTGLFGNTSANKAPGFNFGNTGSTGFNFGSNPSSSAFSFNPTSSLMGGNDANNAAALQQAQQQILAMTSNPFGDSPLFRNPLKDTSRESELLKPTNPSAQKALLSDNQFKVALLPTAKIKPKPWSPSPSGKTYLFDGLEDEEPSLGTAAFLPKRSVKKLVLKNLGTNHSTLTLTSDTSGTPNQSTRIDVSISLNKSDKSSKESNTSPNIVPLTSNISDSSMKNLYCDSDVAITSPKNLSISRNQSEESVPEISLGMDDSIADLHSNRYGIRRVHFHNLSDSDGGGETDLSRKKSSESDSSYIQDSTDSVGITLKRPGYYTIPPLNELKSLLDENGDCFIENFTVGREGYGNVFFPGKINVAGLNLDEIVHFHRKEIEIYPDDSKKPPIGKELNREAIVTLYEVWPTDKTSHTLIQDPERITKMGYAEKIKKSTAGLGAEFMDYIPESGSWIFKVSHFSKYGLLDDSDEEMDITKPPENDKAKALPKVGELNGQASPLMNTQPKQILRRKPISTVAVEDDDMGDMPFQMPNQQEFLFSNGSDFSNDVFSPSRPLFSNIDAERIQGMKASFFHQEMDDDNWGVDPFQTLAADPFGLKKNNEFRASTTKLGSSKLHDSTSSLNKKQRYLEHDGGDRSFMSPTSVKVVDAGIQNSMSSLSLAAKQNEWLSSFPIIKSIPQQPLLMENQVPILNKIRLKPLEKSFMSDKHHLLADAGYFMGRSFRAGWRFDGLLVSVQPPLESDCYSESLSKFFLYGNNVSFSNKSNKRSGFTLSLNEVKINTYFENKDKIQKNLIEALELQLQNSVSTVEDGVPLFVPKPGVELIHAHAKLFENHLKNSDLDSDGSFAKQCVDVWKLLVSLWGKVPGIDEDSSNYAIQMARREAVSSWLIKSSEDNVIKAIANLSQDNYLGKIFLYLTSLRISDAVKLAQQHQDFRMSLLISQVEGTAIIRKWLCNQLLNWEQNGAYKFIKNERIVLYALLAGLLLWKNVYETVNCCKNIDWKQALALHLWYHCEPNAGIQVAVAEYDKAFQGVDNEKYSLPPYPSYIDPFNVDQEMADGSKEIESENVYDTCYHLLKLYCDRSHRLDKLLMPETYTTDHLDYRLSWLLHLALSTIGFNVPADLSATLHSNFAAELESIDMWHWAIFVSLHHSDNEWRMKVVKDILLRHVSLDLTDENEKIEKFLKDRLLLPEKWIFEAKAIKAHSMGKHAEEAWFLLKAGSWNKSHGIVIKHLVSDAIVNEDFDYLKKYLCEMALPERSCTISDWPNGGQVYLEYINMNEIVKGILGREISAYELEKITPEVFSLCSRLSSIPTLTIKDRVCVAEMSKKTATIMRSIVMLQVECSKNKTSLISLASYLKNLPMPHDYAVSENRFIVHEFL